ncbi:MAG TPA: hypothetical protein VMN36_16345 [Verrucomicrobiales bacterium]|nr:hypothetical protein [Verrucomicrobiales bacterium]
MIARILKATIRLPPSSLPGFDPRGPSRVRLVLVNGVSHNDDAGRQLPPLPVARLSKDW